MPGNRGAPANGVEPVLSLSLRSYEGWRPLGIEPPTRNALPFVETQSRSHLRSQRGNKSAELQEVMEAWPRLPQALKQGILGIVRATTTKRST